jgi:PAS domain-containing protein
MTEPELFGAPVGNALPAWNRRAGKARRATFTTRKSSDDAAALKNLVLLAFGSILGFLVAADTGIFGWLEEWARRNELSNLHVTEFATLSSVLGMAAAIFLFRPCREARKEATGGRNPGAGGRVGEARAEPSSMELETIFNQVETAKREWEHSIDSIRDMVILSDLDGTIHRCNRAFKEFLGLSYEEIVRENIVSLLSEFGIGMDGLDLKTLNARFHISGNWFVVRSYRYTDFETGNITRVVIIMLGVSGRKVPEEKVQFVWGHTGNPRQGDGQANP